MWAVLEFPKLPEGGGQARKLPGGCLQHGWMHFQKLIIWASMCAQDNCSVTSQDNLVITLDLQWKREKNCAYRG